MQASARDNLTPFARPPDEWRPLLGARADLGRLEWVPEIRSDCSIDQAARVGQGALWAR